MNSSITVAGLVLSIPIVTLGLTTGMGYGLLAVGLVLVYRSNRVINFAHGEIGAFGAAFFGVAVLQWHIPYWLALPLALAMAAALGAFSEVLIIRRLRHAPKLMSLVATLGLAQVLLFSSLVINSSASDGASFPQPSGLPTFQLGTFLLTRAYTGLLLLSPLVVLGLVLFLRLTRYGLAMRAAAANPDAARMAGVFAARMSTLAWAMAGGVAALTAILLKPTFGFVAAQALGPNLLLRALAAAVVARMSSLPVALGAGVAIGVVEQVLTQSFPSAGVVEVVLFGLILGALLLQTRRGGRDDDASAWGAVLPWNPIPQAVRDSGVVRFLGTGAGVATIVGLALLPLVATHQTATTMVIILAISIIGLSLGIVTGLGGQLSLGQFAIAGVGAAVSYHFTNTTGNFPLGFLLAGAAAAAVSVLIGLPALRIRGLLLAVTTLAFALSAERYFLQQDWLLGGGVTPGRPIFAGYALETGRSYYAFGVVVFALCLLLTRNVWRSGLGRRLRALRDNEDGARAFTVAATRTKIETFALAGFLAGVGGALFGHTLSFTKASDFSVTANVNVIAMAVIGGIGVIAGPLLGAMYAIGIPAFLPISSGGLAASSFGWLVLLLYFPGGLAQLLRPLRDRSVAWAASVGAGVVADPEPPGPPRLAMLNDTGRPAAVPKANGEDDVLLSARGLVKRYGGVTALDGVDVEVRQGETLGLIGPNGAGKTTLFELLGGFNVADAGSITFAGRDITSYTPERRASLGLVRSFQDAALFPTLTVLETVQLALERSDPTNTIAAVLGARGPDRRKEARARELVSMLGLDEYADKQTGELSTGTRRITELCCVIALEPRLLLLDEPSSGVAQRETEALGELLAGVKQHLDATLVVIEHDMPLITSISDRIIAMDSGSVIAQGTPREVIENPLVLQSYLGASSVALDRSGPARGKPHCAATTRAGAPCSRAATDGALCGQHARALAIVGGK